MSATRSLSVLLAAGLAAGAVVGTVPGAAAEDVLPTVTIADTSPLAEGAGPIPVTVTLDVAAADVVSVDVVTADDTALAGADYTATSTTAVFQPGETVVVVQVPLVDDDVFEASEAFALTLVNPVGVSLGNAAATSVILDDDPEPSTYSVSTGSQLVAENAGSVTVVVSRTHPELAGSVSWTTGDGGATAGQDYVAASGTLAFDAGEATRSLTVTLLDDNQVEPPQSFGVRLVSAVAPAGIDPVAFNAVVTTVSNDTGTRLTLGATQLVRSPGLARVFGNLRTTDGTGLAGRDVFLFITPADGSAPTSVARVVTTGADGAFEALLRPTRLSYWQAYYAGRTAEAPVHSVLRTTRVQFSVPTVSGLVSIKRGRWTTFSGLVQPGNSRPVVTLQWLRPDGRIVDLTAPFRTGPDGRYALTRLYRNPGTFRLRIVARPTAANDGSASRVFTLTVS